MIVFNSFTPIDLYGMFQIKAWTIYTILTTYKGRMGLERILLTYTVT